MLALPAALGRLQALAMELLPGRTLMSRDNIDSMRVASVASGKLPGLERLGIETTPLESIAPRYLGHVSGEARLEALARARAPRLTRAGARAAPSRPCARGIAARAQPASRARRLSP